MLDIYSRNFNDKDYFNALNAPKDKKAKEIFVFLNKWHCRLHANPRRLRRFLEANQKTIKKWDKERLEIGELEPKRDEIILFFEDLAQITKYTGTAKTLHVLAPSVFPMWDGAIRRHFGCSENGQGYYNFMIRQQELLKQLLQWIEKGYIALPREKTALKLMDEYHWAMKYKK